MGNNKEEVERLNSYLEQLGKSNDHLNRKLKRTQFVMWTALVIMAFYLLEHRNVDSEEIASPCIGYAEATATLVSSRWWGLSKTRTEIRWMRPTNETSDFKYQTWCFKNTDGAWYQIGCED